MAAVKTTVTSAYNDHNIWSSSASNKPASYELFKFMNEQPLQRKSESDHVNGVIKVEEKKLSNILPSKSTESKSDIKVTCPPPSPPLMANKENVDMQLLIDSNANGASMVKNNSKDMDTTHSKPSHSAPKTKSRAEDTGLINSQWHHQKELWNSRYSNYCVKELR